MENAYLKRLTACSFFVYLTAMSFADAVRGNEGYEIKLVPSKALDDTAPTARKIARIQYAIKSDCRGGKDVVAKAKLHGVFELLKNDTSVYRETIDTTVASTNILDIEVGHRDILQSDFIASASSFQFKFHGFATTSDNASVEINMVSAQAGNAIIDFSNSINSRTQIGVGMMQALSSNGKSFSPSLFARFPIRDDVYKAFHLPTARRINLEDDLINVALYVAGAVGTQDSTKEQLSGGGICVDLYVFKGVRFTYGEYLTFSTDSKTRPHPIIGITLEIR